MHARIIAAYESKQHDTTVQVARLLATRMRMATAGILFADHRVGNLDPDTVKAMDMGTSAQAVRSTAKSRAHIIDSRKAEKGFDLKQKVRELEFSLANVVMFRVVPNSGRVSVIARRQGSHEKFFMLHLSLDSLQEEWVLNSFNRIKRARAISEQRRSDNKWSWVPASLTAIAEGRSGFD